MRCMTRILLVPIFLVPILWVWPQRGTTAAFYTNPQWSNEPASTYEFYASWPPPGDKDESALPTQQLFVHKPLAVMVFLTRRVSSLWLLCWFALALVIAARIGKSARGTANADLRRFALRLTLALAATIVTLLVVEGILRLAHYLHDDRRPLQVQLQS